MPVTRSEFSMELCRTFLAANIPLHKLNNPTLRTFLGKYIENHTIPDESTLRINYLKPSYEEPIQRIRQDIGDSSIWLGLDETTDARNRIIGNVVIGKLNIDSPTRSYLLASRQLDSANHATTINLVNDALRLLWPEQTSEQIGNKFLLLLTDGVAYMKKAAVGLKLSNPHLVSVTCLAHGLSLVAEEVRSCFPEVDSLIANIKKVFLKSPKRIATYKAMNPGLPLPPKPVLTRWGTWLDATEFYSKNYNAVQQVVAALDASEAASIRLASGIFQNMEIPGQLACISANYSCMSQTIAKLEAADLTLADAIGLLERCGARIMQIKSAVGHQIGEKFKTTITKNHGYCTIKEISKMLEGDSGVLPAPLQLSPNQVALFKYAPITTCDVERSFSAYERTLSDRQHSLTTEHLEWMLVAQCFFNQPSTT